MGKGWSVIGTSLRRAVLLVALAVCALAASPASAATWTAGRVDDGSTGSILLGVDCPSSTLCVAVGSNSIVGVSADPAAGAWRTVHPEGYFALPEGKSGRYAGNQITGVSCPITALCVASGPQGHMLISTDPAGGAWEIADLGLEATHLNAISCPSTSLCVAVGNAGKVVTSTNPTGGPSAWSIARLEPPLDLRGVSCASATLCVAVANSGEIVTSTDPAGGGGAWRVLGRPAGEAQMSGIDCPLTSLCVTAVPGRILTSTNPTGGLGAWHSVTAGTGLSVEGFSCPSAGACAAVDDNADAVVSTNPTGGPGAWSFTNVIPAPEVGGEPNGMFGVSCPSRSLCVGVGNDDRTIVSADPFDANPVTEVPAAVRRNGRPRVAIVWHPPKRVDWRRGGRRVGFRFRGFGRVARFECRLSGRGHRLGARRRHGGARASARGARAHRVAHRSHRGHHRRRSHRHGGFSRCHSPVRYRAGRGKHVFRVVAIAPDGRRSRPATFHFRVGALSEAGPVGSCPPGRESTLGHPCIPVR